MNHFVYDSLRDMGIYIPKDQADCLYCGDGWFCFFHQEQDLTVRRNRPTTAFQKLKMDRFLRETLRDMGIYIPKDQADCVYCGGGWFCFFHRQQQDRRVDQTEDLRVDQPEDLRLDQPQDLRLDQPQDLRLDQPQDLRTPTETEPTTEETLPIPSTSSYIEAIPKDETLTSDDVISTSKTFAGLRKFYASTPLTLADPVLIEIPERNPLITVRLDFYSDEMRELIAHISRRALTEATETLGPEVSPDRVFTERSSTTDVDQQVYCTTFIGSFKQKAGRAYHKIDEYTASIFGRAVMPSPKVGLATVLVIPLLVGGLLKLTKSRLWR
ncbi:uncharacterized protein LOC114156893 isoform X3 [Xiphophorus couchianus]|uniref:uncharacterized protein LOC114156893 isoform X3 n=1 Tax=Xiphophorus couchianus TaxID=32473 RepID=UPI0010167E91|nr:uncharacterized protein LOC114156893 isoform X3 [Xiphophorus couchianus]